MLIELENINKIFSTGRNKNISWVLRDINLQIDRGELVAITGPSGSGKTTLANILGLIAKPTSGAYRLNDKIVSSGIKDRELAQLRSEKFGFIFQSYNLINNLSVIKNVLLPTIYIKSKAKEKLEEAKVILEKVGLEGKINEKPLSLSGGEKQRVAIARALINNPEIIIADEPTGNLDSKTGEEIVNLIFRLNQEGRTIVVITHNDSIAKRAKRVIEMLDGRILRDQSNVQSY